MIKSLNLVVLFCLIWLNAKVNINSVSIAKITRSKIAQKNIRILAITIKLSFICKLLVNIASTWLLTLFWTLRNMAVWKCRHRHRLRHLNTNVVLTLYKSPLELKVLCIFVKHVIVNKIATYKLGTCHFVRKCFWKCFANLKKAAVQNPCRKHSALESFLRKLQRFSEQL